MAHGDRTSSRRKSSHRKLPASAASHLNERKQRIRRIRNRRLLGDLFGSGYRPATGGDLLRALRCFQGALQLDADSYQVWIGLSTIFRKLEDTVRADRCLGLATQLCLASRPLSAPPSIARHVP